MSRSVSPGGALLVGLLVTACGGSETAPRPEQLIEELVRREAAEVWTQGNLAVIPELFADTSIAHYGDQASVTTHESMRSMVGTWRGAFPDLQMVVEDVIVSGDKAAARYTVSGTHLGELWGNQPSGKRFRIEQIYIVRVEGGRVVETWGVWDQYGFWRQLSLAPAP